MAKNTTNNNNESSSRYKIERDIQKQIEPLETDIRGLKKQYDKILSTAQKTFEANEINYQSALEKVNKEHIKTLRQTRKENEEYIKNEQLTLERIKKKQSKEIEELTTAHTKKVSAIQRTIDTLNDDRDATLKAIKDKHKQTTKTYQEKIKLYEQNLKTNKNRHETKLTDALNTLKTAHKNEQKTLQSLESELSEDFSRIEKNIAELNASIANNLKQEKNTVDYRINSLRKALNNTVKTLKNHLYTIGNTLKDPFEKANVELNQFQDQSQQAMDSFINKVEFDVKIESHRLNKMLEIDENESVDKETQIKVNTQLQLNNLRKDALIEHTNEKRKLLDDTIAMFKHCLMKTQQNIKQTFDTHETLVDSQLNRFKKKLDIIQNGNQVSFDKLNEFLSVYHSEDLLSPFKSLFGEIFSALHAFERKRISLLSETLNTLKPYYHEIDDIRFFLDTKDAQKEIRINDQKIAIEQRDASLNKEMDLTKRQHDKHILEIEHEAQIKEKEALHSIEIEKQHQVINDLYARKTAQSERAEYRLEKEKQDILLSLKKQHAETDIDQVKQRKTIDQTILERQKAIKALESLRHKHLKLEELKANRSSEHQQLELKIAQNKQDLKRIETTIKQRENRIEKRFERKKENALEEYNESLNALKSERETLKTDHEKKLDFIKQAFERETAKAKVNLDEVNALIKERLRPIEVRHLALKKQILSHIHHLDEATLQETIKMLHASFKESIFEHIHQTIKTLEETNEYIRHYDIKALKDTSDNERKTTQRINRINEFIDNENEKVETLEETMIHEIETAFNLPKETLKKKGNVSQREFNSMIKSFLDSLKSSLQSFNQTANELVNQRFEPMKQNDQSLLDKAEKSYHNALEDEKERFKAAVKPLDIKAEGIEETYQDALKTIDEELNSVKAENIHEAYQQEASIRETLTSQQQKLETLDESLEDQKAVIEERYQDDLKNIEQQHQERLKVLTERYDKQFEKINERLNDAKTIHQQAIINTEHALEAIEGTLKDTFDSNAEQFDYIKRRAERLIESTKKDKDAKLKTAHETLNNKLEDFEEQILTSKARLEEKIEQVTRQLDEEVRIKEARQAQLEKNVSDNEYTLYSSFDEAFKQLEEKFDNAFEDLSFKTRKGESQLEDLKSAQEDILKHYIEETIKDIQSS